MWCSICQSGPPYAGATWRHDVPQSCLPRLQRATRSLHKRDYYDICNEFTGLIFASDRIDPIIRRVGTVSFRQMSMEGDAMGACALFINLNCARVQGSVHMKYAAMCGSTGLMRSWRICSPMRSRMHACGAEHPGDVLLQGHWSGTEISTNPHAWECSSDDVHVNIWTS